MDGDLYIVMNDEELILLFLNRDEDAIRETAKQYGAVLRGVIRNILESEEDTDECLNDVYLALWQNIPSNRPENLRAYAIRLAKNMAIDTFRYNRSMKRSSEMMVAIDEMDDIAGSGDPADEYIASELGRAIEDFLKGLPELDRRIMIRRYWFFDSPQELSKKCGLTPHALNVRLARLRKKLAGFLKKKGF